jgi:streptogramin lyase
MIKKAGIFGVAAVLLLGCSGAWSESVTGVVKDASGSPLRGVMVSAIDTELRSSVSVLSQADGTFVIDGLHAKSYNIRGRFAGLEDNTLEGITAGGSKSTAVALNMEPADDINLQRPANNLLSMIEFDSIGDKENFKMACAACHQVGTADFRAPEEPVDWETMVTRMDGFGMLRKSLQQTIVSKLLDAYTDEAMEDWPPYDPPAPDERIMGMRVSEWDVGYQFLSTVHDIEVGKDGLIYACDQSNDCIYVLDPKTGLNTEYVIQNSRALPRTEPQQLDPHRDMSMYHPGPHSIEADADGNMWFTLAGGGQMAKFDITTKEYTIMSAAPAPATRGGYPHTLRIDHKTGYIWYTDAAREVYRLSPNPPYEVKEYKLPSADQAVGGGSGGESSGRTPYGIDIAPDGMIWYSKLNGNRIGRLDPSVEDGAIKEWIPPFIGPRRLHVAPDGMVWVPGYGSGVIGRFDPKTEEWKVFPMPDATNRIPYALNINPKDGIIWITGTGSDTIVRFDPTTGEFTDYPMPSRVTFTREIEFDEDGNIWTTNSNSPLRHSERRLGSIIKLEP